MGGGVLIIPHSYKYKILLKISKKNIFLKKTQLPKKIKKKFLKKIISQKITLVKQSSKGFYSP
jgi:hypothetical protein